MGYGKKWLAVGVLSGVLTAPMFVADNLLIRTTDTGRVKGTEVQGMLAYQGIPYANRRWANYAGSRRNLL